MIYFVLTFVVFLLIIITLSIFTALSIVHKSKKPDADLFDYSYSCHEPEYELKIKEWITSIKIDYFTVKSPYFYKINCLCIENNNDGKWVILLHGVTLNHKAMMDLAYMYTNLGFNILLWDSRNHGKTEGKTITYGYYEKYDLKEIVDYLRAKHGKEIKIGMHGISMGAGILLSYATSVRDDCNFYIADCPYNNFKQQVFDVAKRKLKLPDFFITLIIYFTQLFLRLFYNFDLGKIDIMAKIQHLGNPAMFITCKDDGYINPDMTVELYEKCSSENKRIILFEEGKHGGAFSKNREVYIKEILEFQKSIDQ